MLEEFRRYCALQRDQAPLALLLIYLKRRGGFVQLNLLWKDLGPSSGGPFWNQTTLLNKLDKLERLEVICLERRVLPSSRQEEKKKTNTFYKINPGSPLTPHIFSMLRIRKDNEKFSSELVEKPLDHLNEIASRSSKGDHSTKRELEVALELISEVFGIEGDDAQEMIRQRMIARGLIKIAVPENGDGQADLDDKKESRSEGTDSDGVKSAKTESSKKGVKAGTRKRSKKAKKENADAQA